MAAVAQNKNAIGYEGMGYISKSVKVIAVDGVVGTPTTARSGKYPLARYLYMFTNGWPEGDLMDFMSFMLSRSGQKLVNASGFVSLQEIK